MDYNQNNYDNNQNNYEVSQDAYNYETNYDPYSYTPEPQEESGMGVAGMVLGIVGFFINPFSLCSILAVVFGIVGMCQSDKKHGCATAALILGGISLVWDIVLSFCSGGVLLFC